MTAPTPKQDFPVLGCLLAIGNMIMVCLAFESWHQFRVSEGIPALLWFLMIFVLLGTGAAANKAARKEIK